MPCSYDGNGSGRVAENSVPVFAECRQVRGMLTNREAGLNECRHLELPWRSSRSWEPLVCLILKLNQPQRSRQSRPETVQVQVQYPDQESPPVSDLVDRLRGGFARAVPGLRLDTDQNWRRTRLSGLRRRRELEAVTRHHPVVVIGRCSSVAGYLVPGLRLCRGE